MSAAHPAAPGLPVVHPIPPPAPSAHGLRQLLRLRRLRQLVVVRVLNSLGDGAFQGALVGSVLFSPQRASSPAALAGGFAIMLLPYSLIGPFAGSLIDRWSRRQVLVWANLARTLMVGVVAAEIAAETPLWATFATALVVLGIGRFIGSCLSAAMPHCVAADSLVGANSLATTAGTVSSAIGGSLAFGGGALIGSTDAKLALVTACVAPFYLAAAYAATRFSRWALGPDATDEPRQPVLAVLDGLHAGFVHLVARPRAAVAVGMVSLVRFCFGVATLLVLVLFRRHFHASGFFRAGAAGIVQVLGFGAAGVFVAALLTAPFVARFGRTRWVVSVLMLAAALCFAMTIHIGPAMAISVSFLLGFAYQATKICADATVQADCDDAHLGRVYSLYDTTNNVLYVLGFVVGAELLTGLTAGRWLVGGIAVVYLLTAVGYAWAMRRLGPVPGDVHPHDLHPADLHRADQHRADQHRTDQPPADQPPADQPPADQQPGGLATPVDPATHRVGRPLDPA